MRVSVLASGSSGNSTFIDGEKKILIDAGISCKKITSSLSALGYDLDELDGILITHEHTDHINGLRTIKKRTDIPIYINERTFDVLDLQKTTEVFIEEEFLIDETHIEPVETSHDAVNPYGFVIKEKRKSLAVFTDFGRATTKIKEKINQVDCAVLESNHDVDMLLNGRYPYHLKQRILGPTGHLSNADAGLLIREHASERLKTVFLAHLSSNNNTPELAKNTVDKIINNGKRTILTDRREMTEFVKI